MTESEWFACGDPTPMLKVLRATGNGSVRQFRLFGCACAARMRPFLTDGRSLRGLEIAELFADGLATEQEREMASNAAWGAHSDSYVAWIAFLDDPTENRDDRRVQPLTAAVHASEAVCWSGMVEVDDVNESARVLAERVLDPAQRAVQFMGRGDASSEAAIQAQFLRDIFGNPVRLTPTIEPAWLVWNNGTVLGLAQTAYGERGP